MRWSQTADEVRVVVDVPGIARLRAEVEPDGAAGGGGDAGCGRALRLRGEGASGEALVDVPLGLFAPVAREPLEARAEPLWAAARLAKCDQGVPWPRLTAAPHAAAAATIASDWSRYAPEAGEDYDDDDVRAVHIK